MEGGIVGLGVSNDTRRDDAMRYDTSNDGEEC
jgi:hypothetical protein